MRRLKNQEEGLNNEKIRTKLAEEWSGESGQWAAKNKKCRGYERVEEEAEEGDDANEDEDKKEGVESQGIVMLK